MIVSTEGMELAGHLGAFDTGVRHPPGPLQDMLSAEYGKAAHQLFRHHMLASYLIDRVLTGRGYFPAYLEPLSWHA